ncbi:MAG: (2Fe-2S)-binding protein [Deltaproteobacteria bacterium]|nr:(2Fe-2S)-binding protein [Deltaproteobacteria bacterium]
MTPTQTIHLKVNDEVRELTVPLGATLLNVLRDAGYHGVKRGCEEGTCASCLVLIDGVPQASCMLLALAQEGKAITTIEAFDKPDDPHPIVEELVSGAGVQCGYCVPGMVLSVKALLDEIPRPTEPELREALDGHLCRCTGYVKQIEAFQRAAERLATAKEASASSEETNR